MAWQVFEMTGDPLQLGLLGLARFIPLFLFGLAAGVVAGSGPQLGELEAGIVATWTSAPTAVAIGGLGTVLAALAVWRWIPGLARYQWEPDAAEKGVDSTQARSSVTKSIDERGPGSI